MLEQDKLHDAYIGLGGNIDDPKTAMTQALEQLAANDHCTIVSVSKLYRTPPWGMENQPDFLNAVARCQTSLTPQQLLHTCLAVEARLHRKRNERWGPRRIDLDILLYGNLVLSQEGLQIPHPRMTERAFVMLPLEDVASGNLLVSDYPLNHWIARLSLAGIEVAESGHWWCH